MSLSFDGAGDYVDHGSALSIDNFTTKTASCWIKGDATAISRHAVIEKRDWTGAGAGWHLLFDGGAGKVWMEVEIIYAANTPNWTSPAGSIKLSRWHHVAITHDGTSADPQLCIDGIRQALVRSVAPSGAYTNDGAASLFTGAASVVPTFDEFKGQIMFPQYFNRILSLEEIQRSLDWPGSVTEGLRLYALYGLSSPEFDYSSFGNHGARTGAIPAGDMPPVRGFFMLPQDGRPRIYRPLYANAQLLTETIMLSDVLAKLIGKPLSESVSLTDALTKQLIFVKTLTETISLTDTQVKLLQLSLTETLTLTDTISKQATKVLTDNLTTTDVLTKSFQRTLTELITLVDTMLKVITKAPLTEVLTLLDTFTASIVTVIQYLKIINAQYAVSLGAAAGLTSGKGTAAEEATAIAQNAGLTPSAGSNGSFRP